MRDIEPFLGNTRNIVYHEARRWWLGLLSPFILPWLLLALFGLVSVAMAIVLALGQP